MTNDSAPPTLEASTPEIAVETRGLVMQFGKVTALNGLDLTVHCGDLFGFIGSNGAGKTTTLRILATFLTPTGGSARILGHDVITQAKEVRHFIGYMPDFFGVYADMEVGEYLDFFGACYRIPAGRRNATIKDILELVGLREKRGALIGTLSRGMQQRLGLARVLIHDPAVLLLDEPASGLDPRARIEVMAILQELQSMGKTILISSHILSELQSLCNRIAIIETGRLIYSGPVQGFQDQIFHQRTYWLKVDGDPEPAITHLKTLPALEEIEAFPDQIKIVLANSDTSDPSLVIASLVQAGIRIQEFRRDEIGLEKVFLHVTRGQTQ